MRPTWLAKPGSFSKWSSFMAIFDNPARFSPAISLYLLANVEGAEGVSLTNNGKLTQTGASLKKEPLMPTRSTWLLVFHQCHRKYVCVGLSGNPNHLIYMPESSTYNAWFIYVYVHCIAANNSIQSINQILFLHVHNVSNTVTLEFLLPSLPLQSLPEFFLSFPARPTCNTQQQ